MRGVMPGGSAASYASMIGCCRSDSEAAGASTERVCRARLPEGDARVYPNGARSVLSLSIAVDDLDASLARYRALLGDAQSASIGTPFVFPGAGAGVATIALGATTLVLTQPFHGAGSHAAGAQQLATRGAGPFAVVLGYASSAAQPAKAWTLEQTHGAAIELVAA